MHQPVGPLKQTALCLGGTSAYFSVRYDEVAGYEVYRASVVDEWMWSVGTVILTGDGCSVCGKSTPVPLC